MDRNSKAIDMTSSFSRLNEKYSQFANMLASITTFDKVLSYMDAKEGASYLNKKRIAYDAYNANNANIVNK